MFFRPLTLQRLLRHNFFICILSVRRRDNVFAKWMWIYTLEARILHFTLQMINALQVREICTKGRTNTSNMSVKRAKNVHAFRKIGFFQNKDYRPTNFHRTIHVYPFCFCMKTSPILHSTFPFRLISPYHYDYHTLCPVFSRVSSSSRLFSFGFQCLTFIKLLLKTSNYLFLAENFGSSISFKPLWLKYL